MARIKFQALCNQVLTEKKKKKITPYTSYILTSLRALPAFLRESIRPYERPYALRPIRPYALYVLTPCVLGPLGTRVKNMDQPI